MLWLGFFIHIQLYISQLSALTHLGEAVSLSFKPESDINQKSCSQIENPISTVLHSLFVYIQMLVSHIKVTNQSSISFSICRPDLCFPRTDISQLSDVYHYNESKSLLFRDSYRYFIFRVKFKINIVRN